MYLYFEATVSPAARTSLGDAKSSTYSAIQCKTCILKLYHFWEDLWMQEGQGQVFNKLAWEIPSHSWDRDESAVP